PVKTTTMKLMILVFFISLIILSSGAFFKGLRKNSLTEPFIAMVLGILLGPSVLNVIHSASSELEFETLNIVSEFTIAIALMATALRLPNKFYSKNRLTQTNIVLIAMVLMWLSSAGIFYLILGPSPFIECL